MNNGRENRNNGNQEKGKKEKETLSTQYEVKRGTRDASPKFFCGQLSPWRNPNALLESSAWRLALASDTGAQFTFRGILFSLSGHRLRYAQKLQCMPGLAVKTPSAIPWAAA